MGSIVYHYTDTQAFAGIVENAALWATNFRYLNDSRELKDMRGTRSWPSTDRPNPATEVTGSAIMG